MEELAARRRAQGRRIGNGRLLFNQYDQVVQAALAGQGVALGRLALVGKLLAEGKLAVATSRPPVATDHGYWLLARRGAGSRALSAVRDWILAEAASAREAWPAAGRPHRHLVAELRRMGARAIRHRGQA
jgi:DNA-binding transcriptional LysR family regulator